MTAPDPPRTVAWIGTGVMGGPMARHLLDAGHALRIFTRTRAKAEPLLEAGATWCATPADAANGADAACSIVGLPEDVEAVHLGPDGTLAADEPPPLLIDLTTSSPALAVRLAHDGAARGCAAVDAPVSGGDVGARAGTLSIMVGGDDDAVRRATPLLDCFGRTIVHQGPPGAGQHAKMVNQILIASTMMGVCEGLLYADAAGLDPERVIAAVGQGAAGSWSINELGPRIVRGDYEPGFFVEHFIKDLGIALDEAARLHRALPGTALARQLYETLRARGLGDKGTQALMLAYHALHAPADAT